MLRVPQSSLWGIKWSYGLTGNARFDASGRGKLSSEKRFWCGDEEIIASVLFEFHLFGVVVRWEVFLARFGCINRSGSGSNDWYRDEWNELESSSRIYFCFCLCFFAFVIDIESLSFNIIPWALLAFEFVSSNRCRSVAIRSPTSGSKSEWISK